MQINAIHTFSQLRERVSGEGVETRIGRPWRLWGRRQCNPLQYSCLENPTEGGAWWAAVHGVVKSRTRLSDFAFTFHFHALEKEMATHSGVLAWRIPGTGEPGGLPSMGSHRIGTQLKRLSSSSRGLGAGQVLHFMLIPNP